MLYGSKKKAVNELRNTKNEDGTPRYLESIDYQALNQKVQAGPGLSTIHNYTLSVSCLEWFIARKVRSVFEVYRKVFHGATNYLSKKSQLSSLEMQMEILKSIQAQLQSQIETSNRIEVLEDRVYEIAERTKTDSEYAAVVGFAARHKLDISRQRASVIGAAASRICKSHKIETGKIADPRFGYVKTYPDRVLKEIFLRYYPGGF